VGVSSSFRDYTTGEPVEYDVKLNKYGPSMLIDPSTGQHDTTGIAAGATGNYCVKFPAFTVMNSFVFLPSLSQPLRLRLYLSGGNYMFTTGAQMLQLNQCYLEVHGIKYAPEVRNELMQLHRRGDFVNKTSAYQHQIFNIGSSLNNVYQLIHIITSLQGEATIIMFWIRPSSQGGSTDYGLGLLQENLELSQVNYITDESGLAILQSLPERFCRRFFIADHFPGSFRSNVVYMLPFSLQPRLLQMDQTLGI